MVGIAQWLPTPPHIHGQSTVPLPGCSLPGAQTRVELLAQVGTWQVPGLCCSDPALEDTVAGRVRVCADVARGQLRHVFPEPCVCLGFVTVEQPLQGWEPLSRCGVSRGQEV